MSDSSSPKRRDLRSVLKSAAVAGAIATAGVAHADPQTSPTTTQASRPVSSLIHNNGPVGNESLRGWKTIGAWKMDLNSTADQRLASPGKGTVTLVAMVPPEGTTPSLAPKSFGSDDLMVSPGKAALFAVYGDDKKDAYPVYVDNNIVFRQDEVRIKATEGRDFVFKADQKQLDAYNRALRRGDVEFALGQEDVNGVVSLSDDPSTILIIDDVASQRGFHLRSASNKAENRTPKSSPPPALAL